MGTRIEALLIEDNCSDAQLVETVLGLSNFTQPPSLRHVERFDAAIDMLETSPFDVVLLDLHLPDGVGPSLVRRLKTVAPNVPVIVLTGMSDQKMEAVAWSEGADDYLVKSNAFSPQRIAEMGGVDVGNALVKRLSRVINQFRLSADFDAPTHFSASLLQSSLHSQDFNSEASDSPASDSPVLDSPVSEHTVSNAQNPSPLIEEVASSSYLPDELSPSEYFVQTTLYSVGITLMSTLGLMHVDQGRYTQAEPLLKGAVDIRKRLLGPTHPDVIVSLHNLATLYDNQGRYIEAECLFYEALKLCEEVFGADSAVTRKFRNHALVISRLNQALDRFT
ncbi:MAG: tetratricopeptide repeat protein [Phormidesmis sp.]